MCASSCYSTWLCVSYLVVLPTIARVVLTDIACYGLDGNRFFFVGTHNSTRIDPDKLRHDKHFENAEMICDSGTKNPPRSKKKLGC